MKNVKIYLFCVIGAVVNVANGQSFMNPADQVLDDGDDQFQKSMEIGYELRRDLEPFDSDNRAFDDYRKHMIKGSLDTIGLTNQINATRGKMLMDTANYKLEFKTQAERNDYKAEWDARERAIKFESVLALYWGKSPTGMLDGRSWYELSDEEKEMYLLRYRKYFNPFLVSDEFGEQETSPKTKSVSKNESMLASAWANSSTGKRDGRSWYELNFEERVEYRKRFADFERQAKQHNKLKVSQNEFAHAWSIKNLANPLAPDWSSLGLKEKNRFRKAYYSYKMAKLAPQINISEEEYGEAWQIAQIGNVSTVDWHTLSDQNVKRKFREKYQALRVNSMNSFNNTLSIPSSNMGTMVAANF
jgi:hypothetical protein